MPVEINNRMMTRFLISTLKTMFVNSILSATSSEDRVVMLGNLPSSSRLASNGHCSDESFVLEYYNS